ncbi:tRNA lysidine(34) synthetase TilS [Halobacteriovorax marinus]|uniref:tRNA(Ile)-lysidine synthase n=1 Tax=Halobacteriovorax marinus TaxID=97084 RepID=A0A1Y5FAD9_9BACT|nr:tRNA lysidine(34) synthetase TilS [Halobacteriovorax marinus]
MNLLDTTQNKFNYKVLEHVLSFAQSAKLFESKALCLGLSAGVDSITLLYILKWLEVNRGAPKVRAIHINHGTRAETKLEEEFIHKYCKNLDVDLTVFQIKMDLEQSNFENNARKQRHEIFFKNLSKQEDLVLAHHIDDSFEWSLMQQLRSSSIESSLGIPVRNGRITRPLMCLTKAHLQRFAVNASLVWMEDASNLDTRYDRNFLRQVIGGPLKERYPKLLKHYVNRSNQMAQDYGKSIFPKKVSRVLKKQWHRGGVSFINLDYKSNFEGLAPLISEAIKELSSSNRGSLHKQVLKYIEMAKSGRKGPMIFSGKVKGYALKGVLFIVHEEGEQSLKVLDEEVLRKLKDRNIASQISVGGLKSKLLYNKEVVFPSMMFGPSSNQMKMKGLKTSHPLLPKTTTYCLENDIWFSSLSNVLDQSRQDLQFYN